MLPPVGSNVHRFFDHRSLRPNPEIGGKNLFWNPEFRKRETWMGTETLHPELFQIRLRIACLKAQKRSLRIRW